MENRQESMQEEGCRLQLRRLMFQPTRMDIDFPRTKQGFILQLATVEQAR